MTTERQVVVEVTVSTIYVEEIEAWTARIRKLGITAYKQTKDEAVQVAKDMFAERVQVHREIGNLEVWLNRFDVDWSWRDQYAGALEVEDVSIKNPSPPASPPSPREAPVNAPLDNGQFAMAA